MDVYDTTAAHSLSDDGISNCEEVITRKKAYMSCLFMTC